MVGKIFLNYRRADAEGWADRLYERLTAQLPGADIFMDIDGNIPLGLPWAQWLDGQVAACDLMLVLIGRSWVSEFEARSAPGERDFVRVEIESALTRNIPVVPVFLGDTPVPLSVSLPASVRPLLGLQATRLQRVNFEADAKALTDGVKRSIKLARDEARGRDKVDGNPARRRAREQGDSKATTRRPVDSTPTADTFPDKVQKDIAPETMGGYSRKMYDHYLGEYVTIRPKYNDTSVIKSYLTRITWDASLSCYCYEEQNRLDTEYSQLGQLYIPLGSSCMYLVTIDRGWVRTVVVSQMYAGSLEMRGLITSQFNVAGPAFAPVCAPIAYLKIRDKADSSFGELTKSDPKYDRYMRILQDILQSSFAHVALPPMSLPMPNVVPLPTSQGSA